MTIPQGDRVPRQLSPPREGAIMDDWEFDMLMDDIFDMLIILGSSALMAALIWWVLSLEGNCE
ncbi:hypothetical protein [Actinosynnema mirum]|nr:hypothetical protein [Actinosynnema mirum]